MINSVPLTVTGHVLIKDKETNEIVLDKPNAIHYGNISTEIAQALVGDNESFITYMAFGNGGVIIDTSGNIIYRKPNTSLNKDKFARLYNTTLIAQVTNEASNIHSDLMYATVPGGNVKNYEDIVVVVTLEQGVPQTQMTLDDANGLCNQTQDVSVNFVFNEIALYTGQRKSQGAMIIENEADIQSFLTEDDKTLITHVIFHPVQKSMNRILEITYTLRIQMADC